MRETYQAFQFRGRHSRGGPWSSYQSINTYQKPVKPKSGLQATVETIEKQATIRTTKTTTRTHTLFTHTPPRLVPGLFGSHLRRLPFRKHVGIVVAQMSAFRVARAMRLLPEGIRSPLPTATGASAPSHRQANRQSQRQTTPAPAPPPPTPAPSQGMDLPQRNGMCCNDVFLKTSKNNRPVLTATGSYRNGTALIATMLHACFCLCDHL